MKVAGKLVAITGGSGGIGRLLTNEVLVAGGTPLVIGRNPPGIGHFLPGDLSTTDGIAAVADALVRHQPDILINLAGMQYFGLLEKQNAEHVSHMFTVNLIAPVLLTQAVLPAMKAHGSGQIVNIGSVFGSIPFAHFVTYSSTKGGLKAFSQALRRELAGSGITVTHVSPRAVDTPLNNARIMTLAKKTKMSVDPPELVARRIFQAIESDAKDVVIGRPESFFTHVHSLLPRVVDKALAKNDRIARDIIS